MNQEDWVGAPGEERRPFKDIRNQRPVTASAKAEKLLTLGQLITKFPPKIAQGGSVADVRHYKAELAGARKVAGNSRSSINDISAAINRMLAFF